MNDRFRQNGTAFAYYLSLFTLAAGLFMLLTAMLMDIGDGRVDFDTMDAMLAGGVLILLGIAGLIITLAISTKGDEQ